MGEPLIMIPGMMSDARAFLPQIVELSWIAAIQIAPPLHGESVEEMAQEILDGAPERFALCGHGLGGAVALEILNRAPARVTRIALMDTSCQSELPQIAAAREPRIVAVKAGRFAEALIEELGPDHLADTPTRDAILEAVYDMAADLGPDLYIQQLRAMQKRPDQQGMLRKALTPALILCGEADTLYPVRRHEFMAQMMRNARLEIVANAGHLPALENPNAVSACLRDWLSWPLPETRVSRRPSAP